MVRRLFVFVNLFHARHFRKNAYKVKAKGAFRPADKPQVQRGSNAGFDPPPV